VYSYKFFNFAGKYTVLIGKNLTRAVALLNAGEVVAIPTETVYGLAANALNEAAVVKVFQIKQRPEFDPLIIHVSAVNEINKYVEEIPELLMKLAEKFMPGPLTLLLEKKPIIPDLVTSGSALVAVRVPDHPVTAELLKLVNFPLAAPSANPFGYISPTTALHVHDQLGDKIPYILDGGPCRVGLESTIVGITDKGLTVFRKGGLPIAAIKDVCGVSPHVISVSSSNPAAPGMLTTHYAPSALLKIASEKLQDEKFNPEKTGALCFRNYLKDIPEGNQVILSEKGDYAEAARNLFAGMRHLDSMHLDLIFAELLPEDDLGIAINDRLRRAASAGH
jgi:L-threonylcarbamoyladenylate synthase